MWSLHSQPCAQRERMNSVKALECRREEEGGLPCYPAPIGCPFLQAPVPPLLLLWATKLQLVGDQFMSDCAALGDISPSHPLCLFLSLSFSPHSCMPSFSALKRRSRTLTTSTWGAGRSWSRLRTSSPESWNLSESNKHTKYWKVSKISKTKCWEKLKKHW